MVLAGLGSSLANALKKLNQKSNIDDEALKTLLNDISRALLDADVNIKLINTLKSNIKEKIKLKELAVGVDIKRLIEKVSSIFVS